MCDGCKNSFPVFPGDSRIDFKTDIDPDDPPKNWITPEIIVIRKSEGGMK